MPWNYILAVLLTVTTFSAVFSDFAISSRLAAVTLSIVMLVQKTGPPSDLLALHRVGEVFLGIIVAIAVATLVFPDRARLRFRDDLAQEFLVLNSFFEGILQGFAASPLKTSPRSAKIFMPLCEPKIRFLEASRNEPSGGPGWREGLGMFSQFGRTMFDALVALESPSAKAMKIPTLTNSNPNLAPSALDI